MKKVVCSILAMAMIVVCVGCGSEQKPAKESKKPPTADLWETETVETPEAPAPAEPATPTITDEEPEIIGSADDIVAWRYNIGIGLDRKILVEKGKVFVSYQGDEGYRLLCLDAKTGKQYWDNDCTYYGFDDYQLITTDALVIDCKLKNENFEYDIACYDIQTGKKFCGIMDYPYITSGIATFREFVYFATYDGVLHCFNVYTGKQNWELKGFDKDPKDVYASDDKVFCCSGKTLSCLNAQDGKKLWQFDSKENAYESTLSNGKIYLCTSNKSSCFFYCLNLQTGKREWSMETKFPITNPFFKGDYVLYMDYNTYAYTCFDLLKQKKIWEIRYSSLEQPEFIDDNLYLIIEDNWSNWSIVDITTGQVTKKLDFCEKYDLAEQRNYFIENDYVQCDVPGSITTDSMFESPSRTRLQRVYKNDTVYVSSSNPKIFGHTWNKKIWETPDKWNISSSIREDGTVAAYFLDIDNRIFVHRWENDKGYFVCIEKTTGKKLWEIENDGYSIDGYDNGVLTLHSIEGSRDINMADGSVKQDRPISFDKLIVFETTLPSAKGFNGSIFDMTDGYYLYVAFNNQKSMVPTGNCYCIDYNGKITTLYDQEDGSATVTFKRYREKFFVSRKNDREDAEERITTYEVDVSTDQSKKIAEVDIPKEAFSLECSGSIEPTKNDLDAKIIKKIGITPHKTDDEYYRTNIKGIYYGKYLICQRQISEGMEYIIPYSDYTGVYDAKTLKKLWSYDKNVRNIYFHDSTIIINGKWDNQVVLFCDLTTGKTLLKYDKATLLGKVGYICFVAYGDKLLAVNLKKLPK